MAKNIAHSPHNKKRKTQKRNFFHVRIFFSKVIKNDLHLYKYELDKMKIEYNPALFCDSQIIMDLDKIRKNCLNFTYKNWFLL